MCIAGEVNELMSPKLFEDKICRPAYFQLHDLVHNCSLSVFADCFTSGRNFQNISELAAAILFLKGTKPVEVQLD